VEEYQGVKVGIAADVEGGATVVRADGSTSVVQEGTIIYENDTVETSAEGAVNITFNDGTTFAVSQNASMVIDEFVYDPNQEGAGDLDISVTRGVFGYTSGFIGKEDPQDVNIETPVGSIGIRGTTFTATIPPEGSGENFKVSILEGAIAVQPTNGGEYILDDPMESLEINPTTLEVTELGVLTPDAVLQSFNVIQGVAPEMMAFVTDAPQEGGNPFNLDQGETVVDEPAQGVNEAGEAQDQEAQEESQDGESTEPATNEDDTGTEEEGIIDDELSLDNEDSLLGSDDLIAGEAGILDQSGLIGTTDALGGLDALGQTTTSSDGNAANTAAVNNTVDPNADNFNPATSGVVTDDNNTAPITTPGLYVVFEQLGIEGGWHNFNISRYFSDPDGDALSFSVTASVPTALAIPPDVINGNLYFEVVNPLGTYTTQVFTVTASDGEFSVSKDFEVGILETSTVLSPTNGADTFTVTTDNSAFSALGGNDDITVTANFGVIFGEAGADLFTVYGNNNQVFGDSGDDALTISSGTDHTISGGSGDDTLTVEASVSGQFYVFGGSDNDLITLSNDALVFLQGGPGLVAGGEGFDTLYFSENGNQDLTTVNNENNLGEIEKISTDNTLANFLDIDINNIFSSVDSNFMFIDTDTSDIVAIHGTGDPNGSTLVANQTGISNPFDGSDANTYNLYSYTNTAGDTVNLYIDQSANDVVAVT